MATEPVDPQWVSIGKLVRTYSYITWGAVIYGILVAHLPFLIGHPWTTCKVCGNELDCVLAFHLYEVPMLLYNAYLAWYGLSRFSRATVQSYMSLLSFAATVNLAFFTFEVVLLRESICNSAPAWENWGLVSVSLVLSGGAFLAVYVKQKLIRVVYSSNQ